MSDLAKRIGTLEAARIKRRNAIYDRICPLLAEADKVALLEQPDEYPVLPATDAALCRLWGLATPEERRILAPEWRASLPGATWLDALGG